MQVASTNLDSICRGILNCGLLHEVINGPLWSDPMQQWAWKPITFLASQEIPCTLWDLKVHYCVCNSLPLVTILSQISLFQDFLYYFCTMHFNIIFPPPFFEKYIKDTYQIQIKRLQPFILYDMYRSEWRTFLYTILIRSNKMQQYAGVYLLRSYSTHVGATTFCQRGLIRPHWRKGVAPTRDTTCTRSCSYSLMYSWWWVRRIPETCRVILQ